MSEAQGDQLSEAEEELVRVVALGQAVDCRRKPIRASVLRDLILEARSGWTVPPAGIRLNRAVIQGCLDLEGCTIAKPLLVWHSRFEAGGDRGAILLRDARVKRLGIHSCTVEGNIVADRAELENGIFLGGGKVTGMLTIRGGSVGGALALEGTEIGDGKAALLGAGVRVSGPLILRRARIAGEVAVPRAHLLAGIYAEEMSLAFAGVALNAESARIAGDMLMERARITGAVRLRNARVEGRLAGEGLAVDHVPEAIDARGVNITNGIDLARGQIRGSVMLDGARIGKAIEAEEIEVDGGETAISADVISVGGNWAMPRAKLIGQLAMPGADIEGQLRLTEVRLFGSAQAIRGDGARVRGGCFMSRATIVGVVRFPAAEIGNQLRLRGATLKVEDGVALLASGTRFRRDVELNDGFQTVGAVVLDHANISGVLDLGGSHLKSAAIARAGLAAARRPEVGRAAAIARNLDELALSLVDAEVDRLVMPARSDERPRGIIDLSRAHVGSFEDFADAWPLPNKARERSSDGRDIEYLVLDGFAYDQLSNPAGMRMDEHGLRHSRREDQVARQRIKWLEGQQECDLAEHFKPQAWVALAQRLALQGYTEDAQAVTIARRRRERRSHSASWASRWQSRFLDWFALYGYNPWRTIAWMTGVVLLFACIWAGAARFCGDAECFDESVFVVSNRDAYNPDRFRETYPGFHALAYSFDVFVPFVSFGYEDHWRPNLSYGPIIELPNPLAEGASVAITLGGILYVLGVIEAILGIVLTSLAVTGFTGLLRVGEG